MGKSLLLVCKIFTLILIFIENPRVLGKEEIKADDLKENEVDNFIKKIKEEIKEVNKTESRIDQKKKEEEQNAKRESEKKIFEEFGMGLSEKGFYFDFIKDSDTKNKFGIRINYLPEDLFTHKDIYVNERNIRIEHYGIGMLYKHYLFPKESKSNFYLQANADISNFKISHEIDLTKETYTLNNLQVTCSACGILTIQTDPEKIHIIPTISLGYQYKITPNFKTNLSLGMQYIDPGSLENFTNTTYSLPTYVQSRIDEWVKDTQNKIDEYSDFLPSINIGFSYSF